MANELAFFQSQNGGDTVTDMAEQCRRCGWRAYEHARTPSNRLLCNQTGRAPSYERIGGIAANLEMLMKAARDGVVIGQPADDPPRMTVAEAARRSGKTIMASKLRKRLGNMSRDEMREAAARERADERRASPKTDDYTVNLNYVDQFGNVIRPESIEGLARLQEMKLDFARFLGVTLGEIDTLYARLGLTEFENWYENRSQVAQQMRQAADELEAEKQRALANARDKGIKERLWQQIALDDYRAGYYQAAAPPTPKPRTPAPQPAVAIHAKRKYFEGE